MKKLLLLLLMFVVSTSMAFSYSIKLYNDNGYMIGTAKKNGEDYEIYDLNDNRVKDYDAFYNSPGDANRKQLSESKYFDKIPGYDWVRVTKGSNGIVRTRATIEPYVLNKYQVRHLSVKIYDKTGKLIGYAKTDGYREYSLYDLNDNPLQIPETVYSPPGTPLKSYMGQLYYQISR